MGFERQLRVANSDRAVGFVLEAILLVLIACLVGSLISLEVTDLDLATSLSRFKVGRSRGFDFVELKKLPLEGFISETLAMGNFETGSPLSLETGVLFGETGLVDLGCG